MWRNFHRMQGGFRRMRRNLQRIWRSFHGIRWNSPRIRRGFYGMRRNSQRMRRSFNEMRRNSLRGVEQKTRATRRRENNTPEARGRKRGSPARSARPTARQTPRTGFALRASLASDATPARQGGGAERRARDDERQTRERGEKGAATREGVRRFGLHPRRGLPAGPGSRGRRVRHGPSLA